MIVLVETGLIEAPALPYPQESELFTAVNTSDSFMLPAHQTPAELALRLQRANAAAAEWRARAEAAELALSGAQPPSTSAPAPPSTSAAPPASASASPPARRYAAPLLIGLGSFLFGAVLGLALGKAR